MVARLKHIAGKNKAHHIQPIYSGYFCNVMLIFTQKQEPDTNIHTDEDKIGYTVDSGGSI